MNVREKKGLSKLGYETKFIIILVLAVIGITLLYFAMEYTFEKVKPKQSATIMKQSGGQNAMVIEE